MCPYQRAVGRLSPGQTRAAKSLRDPVFWNPPSRGSTIRPTPLTHRAAAPGDGPLPAEFLQHPLLRKLTVLTARMPTAILTIITEHVLEGEFRAKNMIN